MSRLSFLSIFLLLLFSFIPTHRSSCQGEPTLSVFCECEGAYRGTVFGLTNHLYGIPRGGSIPSALYANEAHFMHHMHSAVKRLLKPRSGFRLDVSYESSCTQAIRQPNATSFPPSTPFDTFTNEKPAIRVLFATIMSLSFFMALMMIVCGHEPIKESPGYGPHVVEASHKRNIDRVLGPLMGRSVREMDAMREAYNHQQEVNRIHHHDEKVEHPGRYLGRDGLIRMQRELELERMRRVIVPTHIPPTKIEEKRTTLTARHKLNRHALHQPAPHWANWPQQEAKTAPCTHVFYNKVRHCRWTGAEYEDRKASHTLENDQTDITYHLIKVESVPEIVKGETCHLCVSPYQVGNLVQFLCPCDHAFHPDCIFQWLSTKNTCPVCRAPV